MPVTQTEKNIARISGAINSAPQLSHMAYGEGFYSFDLKIMRTSGSPDYIPVLMSDRLAGEDALVVGRNLYVEGQFRSHNVPGEEHSKLKLMVFARKVIFFDEEGAIETMAREDESAGSGGAATFEAWEMSPEDKADVKPDTNEIILDGFICKPPVFRVTPLKREIADILLAVNRMYNKSDYIPCICWGRNARFCGKRQVGEHVKITGRIQSRFYTKKYPNGTEEQKIAYEVSIAALELVDDSRVNDE
ncbi:MAG: single-stranded DNA-binding protein [Clostridia bacterium]|nr:single-stranded DNA-binding protein [Clostridia bacterium]